MKLPDISSALYGTEPDSRKAEGFKALVLRVIYRLMWPILFVYAVMVLRAVIAKQSAKLFHVNNGGYPGAVNCLAAALA
ncbi:MAG: hypothetical protein WCS77_00710, partial [Elusimicrobiaceae bacterium]